MKVGFVQFAPKFGEKKYNIDKTLELICEGKEADLLVLPELCNTGYLFTEQSELNLLAEKIPEGGTIKAWEKIAKDTTTYIVAGILEKFEGDFYNSSVLIGPDGFIDTYRKVHLFDREKLFFKPGKGPFNTYNICNAKIGMMVCFDWAFPEIARILALKGAEILCHPSNLVLSFAQRAMLTRSIENRVFTITSNRTGIDERPQSSLKFTGQSQITSPKMKILARAGKDTEETTIISINPDQAKDKMITNSNHVFLDRRVELYESILNKNTI